MTSRRCGEDWLGQGALCAVGHCAGAPAFPAGSGQLGAEGRASCCGVVWGFCIVVGFYRSHCPGTIKASSHPSAVSKGKDGQEPHLWEWMVLFKDQECCLICMCL